MLEIDSQILLALISRIKSQLVPINYTRDADARTCQYFYNILHVFDVIFWQIQVDVALFLSTIVI